MKSNVRITLIFVVVVSLIASALGITVKFSLPNEIAQEEIPASAETQLAEQQQVAGDTEQSQPEETQQEAPVEEQIEEQPEEEVEFPVAENQGE